MAGTMQVYSFHKGKKSICRMWLKNFRKDKTANHIPRKLNVK
jgi:hypothetical protein